MTMKRIDVEYPYVYDLYYRTRNALLQYEEYRLDFSDWVKAGLAFNVLGAKDARRKASYFGELYDVLETSTVQDNYFKMKYAIAHFYEDLFQLYQDHLVAQLRAIKESRNKLPPIPRTLTLLPTFAKSPCMSEVFPTQYVDIATYCAVNPQQLEEDMSTLFADRDSILYKGIALMYDYGMHGEGDGILLEVK